MYSCDKTNRLYVSLINFAVVPFPFLLVSMFPSCLSPTWEWHVANGVNPLGDSQVISLSRVLGARMQFTWIIVQVVWNKTRLGKSWSKSWKYFITSLFLNWNINKNVIFLTMESTSESPHDSYHEGIQRLRTRRDAPSIIRLANQIHCTYMCIEDVPYV